MLNDDTFVSGDDAGRLAIWSTMKKKPAAEVNATGPLAGQPCGSREGGAAEALPWVTALASVRSGDLVASGSSEGVVRLWAAADKPRRSLAKVMDLSGLVGFANSLQFASDGRFLLCAMGQEHRLGRWERNAAAKNALALVPLPVTTTGAPGSDEEAPAADE